jgi:hypothetical protein
MNQEAWRVIGQWIGNNLWVILLLLSLVVQITPIKINPWSALFKWIGRTITGDACSKIDNLVEKVDKIDQDVMSNEKDRIRWEILDFANSCRNNRRHTRDEFQHIVELHDKYLRLLKKTGDKNGVFKVEYEYIEKIYAERLEKNDFL